MTDKIGMIRWPLALLTSLIVFWGCAVTSRNIRTAREYFNSGNYDQAAELLQAELQKHPNQQEIRIMLFRAKLNSYYYHLLLAREKRKANDREGANSEYTAALNLFPNNTKLKEEIDSLNQDRPQKKEPPPLTIQPPVTLDIKKTEKVSMNLKNTPVMNIFKSLGKSFGINFIFDKDFRDFVYSIEVENLGFYDVLNQLCMVSASLYRILDRATVLIYPDIFNKRRSFDLRGIKTFYLSNIKAEDAKKILLTVFRDEQPPPIIQEEPNLNALVIRSDFNTLTDIEKFLATIDKEKNEVEINIEIMEINRNLINKLGTDFGTNPLSFSAGTLDDSGKLNQRINLSAISDTSFFLTLPSLAINFLESDANNKIIAKPNLRGLDGEDILFMVGDEIPVPETQFQAIAAGGINSSPVTTYRYRNIGVEIKLTPFIHQNNEVTLKIKLTMTFISGSGFTSSFPIFGKREIENKIRLKEGETNIIGGFIKDDIRKSLSGFPALSKIPILGSLFGTSERNITQTDLIFSITPKIIRKIPMEGHSAETIWDEIGQPTPIAAGGPRAEETREFTLDRPMSGPKGNGVNLLPPLTRVAANSEALFYLNLHSDREISSLALNGTVAEGNCEILEIKTDFFPEADIRTLKNISGSVFDLGFTFNKIPMAPLDYTLAQFKIKFLQKGKYTLIFNSVTAYDSKRNNVELTPTPAQVEVY